MNKKEIMIADDLHMGVSSMETTSALVMIAQRVVPAKHRKAQDSQRKSHR
jgi:hypothetical protein